MLNIYRVISLSLVMSLFFAAPLLCIQPVAYRLKQGHSVAAKARQSKNVRVVWKRGSPPHAVKAAAALASSLRRSVNNPDKLRQQNKNRGATPAVFVQEQDENWYDDESDKLDDAGVSDASASSHTYGYY